MDAEEAPPSTERAVPSNDVASTAAGSGPYQAQVLYRAVPPPPRPASPTPVYPFQAYRPDAQVAQVTQAATAPEVKRHESYYPMEVPIDGAQGVRESSMFPAATTSSAMAWALGGVAAFAVVLGLLVAADRVRHSGHEGVADAPRAASELPVAKPAHAAQRTPVAATQEPRGIDPSELPITRGVDVSTLPLVSAVSAESSSPARSEHPAAGMVRTPATPRASTH